MANAGAVQSYRRAIQKTGQDVTFRRITGRAPRTAFFDAIVKAHVVDASAKDATQLEISNGVKQNSKSLIVLASDLEAAGFSTPPVTNTDKVMIQGSVYTITNVDTNTREYAGAYHVRVIG